MNETLKNIMARRSILHSIRKNNLLALTILLFVSCCKSSDNDYSALGLRWSLELPHGSSLGICWEGAMIMPMFDNVLVAHTTLHDDWDEPWTIADNRLCGINIVNKTVEWLYPKTEDITVDIMFNSLGYHSGRVFVVRYEEKDNNDDDSAEYNTVAALDIVSGEELWRFKERTYEWTRFAEGIVGQGDYCYFVNDGQRVYKTNIQTGETELFYSSGEMRIANTPFFLTDGRIAILCYDWNGDLTDSMLLVINPLTKEVEKRITMPKVEGINRSLSAINKGNILYCYISEYNFAYDIDNEKILWECWTPGCDNAMDLLLRDDILYKAGDSWTYALDAKTGTPLYDYPELGADRVTIDDGKVYFVASYGTLYIMNLKDGRILSATECPGYGTYFFGSYPTIYDNKLYIMGGTQLHCYKI